MGDQGAITGIAITISPDRLSAFLSCPAGLLDPTSAYDVVRRELDRLKLRGELNRETLEFHVSQSLMNNTPIENYLLFQGTPPEDPIDGRVEWTQDFFSRAFHIDAATGRMDYRTRVGNPSVVAAQKIARMRDPIPGKPGVDVFGKPITVRKPDTVRMRLGRNIGTAEEGHELYATASGRVRFAQGTLSVDEVFEVRESIGLRTGNIDHPGALHVQGDILNGAHVYAAGDIIVTGGIEPSMVASGGSIIAKGGITGDHHGHAIRAANEVHARYFNEADIEAGELVTAAAEIRQSIVRTRGPLSASTAKVIGGEICALGGIDILESGSESGVPTHLTAGVDFKHDDATGPLLKQLESLHADRHRIMPVLESLVVHLDTLPPKKREAAEALLENVHALDKEIEAVEGEIAAVKKDIESRSRMKIVVRNTLHQETLLQIGDAKLLMETDMPGPIQATLHEGEIVLSYATLADPEEPQKEKATETGDAPST